MCFGDILPFVHIYGKNNRIKEYRMNENPDSKEREWIISHLDDCDLGDKAWISYDEGDLGTTHAILFSSRLTMLQYLLEETHMLKADIMIYLFQMI